MKSAKLFLALLIILNSLLIGAAQKKSDEELFDSFGKLGCSDLRGRIDNFLVKLRDEPGAVGYIIFYSEIAAPATFAFYDNAVRTQIEARRFPVERVKFINTAATQTGFKVEFIISSNGENPSLAATENNLALDVSKRYLFAAAAIEIDQTKGKLIYVHESECSLEAVNYSLLAKYLAANPGMSAEVLVSDRSKSRAAKVMKLFLSEAQTGEDKISPQRLKISYAGFEKTKKSFRSASMIEIRLVPRGEQK